MHVHFARVRAGSMLRMAADEHHPRLVHCVKLQRDLPGLDAPPWPGPLGQRIYEHVSAEAWEMWEERMKMILNEYRLLPFQKEAQQLIAKHMEEYFFGEGAALPPGYTPEGHH
jgi:Fe-S cluster biosynthesis and repair protein YggX